MSRISVGYGDDTFVKFKSEMKSIQQIKSERENLARQNIALREVIDSIDVEKGNIRPVRTRYIGKQILQQSGGSVEAHRYSMRGQLDREAWYDVDCVLVRWDLPLADGQWISIRRTMS